MFFGAESDAATRRLTQPVRVLETGVYRGAHYYSHMPMVRIMLDLGRMEEWPSNRLPGFTDRLIALLPGLERHGCCYKEPGGFVRRLRDGTWLGHIAEHVALELQSLAGHRLSRGKTRGVKGREGVYNIMFAYEHEGVALAAGRAAIELLDTLLLDHLQGVEGLDRLHAFETPFDLDGRLAALRRLVRRTSLGPTTQALVDEARRRDIPVQRLNEGSLIQLGQGKYQQRLRASVTGRTSLIAVEAAGDKDFTKRLLGENGIPVPRGAVVQSEEEAVKAARRLGYPLVTKPLDGNHGRGVTTDIGDSDQLRAGFAAALAEAKGRSVIVEQHLQGRDHRILVVGGNVIAVAERIPAHVVGDGQSTIAALIERVNCDPRRGEGHEKVMTRIKTDAALVHFLARSNQDLDTVPGPGEVVFLRPTANLSTGGTAVDRTNEIHPDNAEIARRAALILGLDVAGIDFLAPDITRSVRETGGGIVEVNAAPGFRMHIEPSEGVPRDVAKPVIGLLYPEGAQSRVPIIALTGTNGKSTTGRMVKHILRLTGAAVGLTSTSGVYVNDCLVAPGDATGPKSARKVLNDPTVEVAVLETARGGILREGLGYERADIGAALNVTPDHLGLKGIETIEDLARLKSLVVETVSRRGTSVLNADDPMTRAMARRARGRICWFSLAGGGSMAPWLQRHIDRGGMAVVREQGADGGCIVLHRDGRREAIIWAAEIPATLHGLATFNIANALAAAAICAAYGVPLLTIRAALATFHSSFEQNPGRLNVHDAHGFRVIMDYAHNPAGLNALGEAVSGLRSRHKRSIGVISIPGDRRDEDIMEMGRISARIFDTLFFREDPGTRGRTRGQVMALLKQGAVVAGISPSSVHLIRGEAEATDAALRSAEPGDLVILTPTDVEGCWKQVLNFQTVGGGSPAAYRPRLSIAV